MYREEHQGEMDEKSDDGRIQEVLARAGLVYSEKSNLNEVMCKPKLMPLKSVTLERIEKMQQEALNKGFKPGTGLRPNTSQFYSNK